MASFILRRRGLGNTSARMISEKSQSHIRVWRSDRNQVINRGDLVIRWGCTSEVGQGATILNSSGAIHKVNNKTAFRLELNEKGLCPKTWTNERGREQITYPCVVRPQIHHQGRNLYVCQNRAEFLRAIQRCGAGWYASELIDKEAEYRVFVVSGRAVAVARKYPNDQGGVAWNVAQGGRFENVRFGDWPLKSVRMAIEAHNLSGLDFSGVDVMVKGNEAYILEINSAPSLTSDYRQSCMAKAFDYIVENGKAPIPVVERRGDWKKFVHPAISNEALI